jgi:hypothetical protein
MENKRDEELMERSSECSESQGDGTAPNGAVWSSLAVNGHSRREGIMEEKGTSRRSWERYGVSAPPVAVRGVKRERGLAKVRVGCGGTGEASSARV